MKRISLMAILIGFVAICFIVTFSYATNSVLTSNQISEIWGAADCRRCIPPTAWESEGELTCNADVDDYDCHDWLSRPMKRVVYCVCNQTTHLCKNSTSVGGYSDWQFSCFQSPRNETCD